MPATLSLTLGAPATFGAFTPGVAKEYTAATTANVDLHRGRRGAHASASPATSPTARSALPQPLQVAITPNAWGTPVSNVKSTIAFKQAIGANDALRTGSYSKTLTFTLSTTNP